MYFLLPFYSKLNGSLPFDCVGGENGTFSVSPRLVWQAVCEESRLEKERSAVLSELTMVNTIDYRMECQVLSALHAENQLSRCGNARGSWEFV